MYASVSFTMTTADDDLAAKVEPLAPQPSACLAAMRVLVDSGIAIKMPLYAPAGCRAATALPVGSIYA